MAQTRDDETEKRTQEGAEASQDTSETTGETSGQPEENVDTGPAPVDTSEPEAAELIAPEHDPSEGATPVLTAPEHDPRDPAGAPLVAGVADTPETVAAPEAEPEAPIEEASQPAPAPQQPERRGGFGPALLGGVVAAGIGFGAAMIAFPPVDVTGLEQTQRDQAAALDDLQAQLDAGPDLSALTEVTTAVSDMQASLTTLQDDLAATRDSLGILTGRVDALEAQPLPAGASDEAVAAYEAELQRLQQAMQDQRDEIASMVDESQQMRADAAATARDTQVRAALVRLNGALDEGAPFETPLKTLAELGLEIPPALDSNAPSGVPTLARLRADFPEAARDALAATRDGSLGGSFGDFLKNQLGARSLTPQEGTDTDAILSRAEAALNDGDLQTVLVELDGLPEPALAAVTDWMDLARTRADALAAAETLSEQTN